MSTTRLILSATLGGMLLVACGCQAKWGGKPESRYIPDIPERPKALVLATPEPVRLALAESPGPRWYEYRNDARLTTFAGVLPPGYEYAATFTYDRQTTAGNRSHDYYTSTVYRWRYQAGER